MSGSRGPLTVASSRRGERERRHQKSKGDAIVQVPERPDWLPVQAMDIWDVTIEDLEAARVPLQRIDGHAIAFYVACILQASEAAKDGDFKLAAKLNKDALQWATQIGATPLSRLRMQINPEQVRRPSKWDEIGF